ncbi:MAG: cellulase family glycosylhydrolase [Rhizomicrobium sp.]|jgi:mannan endo-1,4-beta-mannosidase
MISRRSAVLAGALLTGGCASGLSHIFRPFEAKSNFVRVNSQRFVLGGQTYRFAGTNVWYGAYLGAPTAYGNRDRLRKELDTLAANGMTNLRVLGASELSPLKNSLTTTFRAAAPPYNEDLLAGLDFLLAEMGKRDMKAVVYLNNFWEWSGGMVTYLYWTNGGHYIDLGDPAHPWPEFADFSAQFYSSPPAVALYLQYVGALITRTNNFTGIAYRDDPAIMAWELANEPRVGGSKAFVLPHLPAFYAWIARTAKFIKARDPNHLVTTGSEGLRGCLDMADVTEKAHAVPEIDYMTFHLWPLNWSWINLKDLPGTYEQAEVKGRDHVKQHIAIAQKINKPLVAEEFGFPRDNGYAAGSPTTLRDRFYGMMFAEVLGSARSGGPFAGTNFWTWGGSGRAQHEDYRMHPGDTFFVGDPPQEPQGANSVFDCDATTLEIIRAHAGALKTVAG